MTPEQHKELLQQIAELRREYRNQRRWLVFISACTGVLLFFPEFAAFVGARSTRFVEDAGGFLVPLAAILVVAVIAALIISRFSSASQCDAPEGRNV